MLRTPSTARRPGALYRWPAWQNVDVIFPEKLHICRLGVIDFRCGPATIFARCNPVQVRACDCVCRTPPRPPPAGQLGPGDSEPCDGGGSELCEGRRGGAVVNSSESRRRLNSWGEDLRSNSLRSTDPQSLPPSGSLTSRFTICHVPDTPPSLRCRRFSGSRSRTPRRALFEASPGRPESITAELEAHVPCQAVLASDAWWPSSTAS